MYRVPIILFGSLRLKRVFLASAFALAFVLFPSSAVAIEIGPGPGPGDSEVLPGLAAEHAGAYVEEDVSFDRSQTSVIVGDELSEATPEWLVHFLMPFSEDVPASRAAFVLGQVNPDFVLMINGAYDIAHAEIPGDDGDDSTLESASVSFPNFVLKDPVHTSGVYGLFVYVYPEFKYVYDPETDSDVEEPYTEADFLEWFQWSVLIDPFEYEGEIPETYGPEETRFLAFEYVAATGPVYQECCSSVIFLPGFQGSVLKSESGTNTLWPPTLFHVAEDLSDLAISESGESATAGITVEGILENFAVGPFSAAIYQGFANRMDGLLLNQPDTNKPLIKEWRPLAYDWRFSPEKILADGIQTSNGPVDIVHTIEQMAEDSNTGQVTIVAHSMGGLLGKAIIKELETQGKQNLIDSFVMVGVPQLGTPQAMTGLLHGEGAQIPAILSKEAARTLAYSMPSAYNLLPSEEYFNRVNDPVVVFDSTAPQTQTWRNFWGVALANFSEYFDFMVGSGPGRTRPAPSDTQNPEVLRTDLVQNALDLHAELDTYEFPNNVNVVQIAGWGSQTITGLIYTEDDGILDYQIEYTVEGDNTVLYPSAISYQNYDSYFAHLTNYNRITRNNAQHRNLTGAAPILRVIESVIKEEIIAGIDFISKTKPEVTSAEDALLVSAHSPVTIGVYDEFGNFTGIAPGQDTSADLLFIQEDIPGSSYQNIGEGKYLVLPKQGTYTFAMQGTGSGDTTVFVEKIEGDEVVRVAAYSNIPTSPQTSASFLVDSGAPENTEINLDSNGDGEVDMIIVPDSEEFSLMEIIGILKEKINSLNVKEKLKNNLLKRVGRLENKIEKKITRNQAILTTLQARIDKKTEKGKIAAADAETLSSLLAELEVHSDKVSLDSALLQELRDSIEDADMSFSLKQSLLNRVGALEKKTALITTLSRFTKAVAQKGERGRISDEDVEGIIDLLAQIENAL